MAPKYKITLVRSLIGHPERQRRTARALGLKRINQSVIKDDNGAIRGQIRKIKHLVKVEQLEA